MSEPIPLDETQKILEEIAAPLQKAIDHASGRDIDAQQVEIAQLADVATKHRAALDLLAYAREAGRELYSEQAAIYAGHVVSEVSKLVHDFCDIHGLSDADAPSEVARQFGRRALAPERVRAIGRAVADAKGSNDGPLEEMLEMTRDAVREFATTVVAPQAEHIHRTDAMVPEEFITQMSELDFFGMSVPEEFGGAEMGNTAMCITTEELSRASLASAGSLITRPEILSKALLAGGTAEQKRKWLPRIASGELMVGISVTEPDIGSDVAGVKCRAERATVDGVAGWTVTGPKAWCTFAGRADILAVLLRTDPDPAKGARGLSLFIAEKDRFAGHEFEYDQPGGGKLTGKADATPGYRGMHSFTLSFENFFIPAENLIGGDEGEGKGFYLQMGGFAAGRLQTGARATGVSQAALEETARYVVDRIQFGHPIADFQLTQYDLGWMAVLVEAGRQLTYAAAAAMDADARKAAPYAAQAKMLASDIAVQVTQMGQLLHGGWGYAEEYPISRYVVDAQVLPIFEGVKATVQLKVVGRSLVG